MTAVADTVALNMSYERASVNGLTDHDEQEASSKKLNINNSRQEC